MKGKVKIGLLGVGHLGRIHLRLLKEIEGFHIVGFYDPDDEAAQQAALEFEAKRFADPATLIAECDAIDIVTPTMTHFEMAVMALKKGRHIFIEKPLTHTLEEARKLHKLIDEARVQCMVGHVERFNPAFLSVQPKQLNPLFIEVHRLAQFNPRGTDVSVVHDLMIHDIDLILSMVKGNIKRISASGVPIVSDTPDIANARIEFDNGCVANITASRISIKNMRKMRIFQHGAYVSMDFLERKAEVFSISDIPGNHPQQFEVDLAEKGKKYITYEKPEPPESNAIRTELEHFLRAIQTNQPAPVTALDGLMAMEVGHKILEKIKRAAAGL
ncbi:MAG: Gfo/Idh/MocA family oxidoreductase [Chitinophagales bacterium]